VEEWRIIEIDEFSCIFFNLALDNFYEFFMKLFYFFIISFCVFSHGVISQTPTWQWAKSAGSTQLEYSEGIAVDVSGNIYTCGRFDSPTITFGSTVLTNAGQSSDIYLVKYDPFGNVLWAKSAGGLSFEYVKDLSVDGGGNVYVTGSFNSSTITFGNITLTNTGLTDLFIVKYNASGSVMWAKSASGNDSESGVSVDVDVAGNVLLTGIFSSSMVTFDTSALMNSSFSSTDLFVVKYDSSGNVIWARSAGSNDQEYSEAITTDLSGNVIVSGYFASSTMLFGSTLLTNINPGVYKVFIVKFDSVGNVVWAKSADGNGYNHAFGLATDSNENILVTGGYQNGSITFDNIVLANAGSANSFIVKYDPAGNIIWAKSEGGNNRDIANSIACEQNGNFFVGGWTSSSILTIGNTVLTNAGINDIWFAKYDPSGNVIWAKSVGSSGLEDCAGIAVSTIGEVYIVGWYDGPALHLGNTVLINYGGADIFTAKLDAITGLETSSDFSARISFYPNPTTGLLNISSPEVILNITAFNSLGQIVNEPVSGSKTALIQLDEPGIYNIRISTVEGIATKRVVVTK
jgi:hypothetical protein